MYKVIIFLVLLSFNLNAALVKYRTMNASKILKVCQDKYKYDRCPLVIALAFQESRYNPNSFNPEKSGSFGLGQLQCSTARMLGLKYSCKQLYNPILNIRFMIKLLQRLESSGFILESDLIAAYNAGRPIRCDKFREYPWGRCYKGEYINQEYVNSVTRHLEYLIENL